MICWGGNTELFQKLYNETVGVLEPIKDEFDSIVASGMSGLLMAAPVSLKLGKQLIVIRREGDKHAGAHLGIENSGSRVLFLDDHVSRGRTFNECRQAIINYHEQYTPGAFKYGQMSSGDKAWYIREYGEAACKRRWPWHFDPNWKEPPQPTVSDKVEITIAYLYNTTGGYSHGLYRLGDKNRTHGSLWNRTAFDHFTGVKPVTKAVRKLADQPRNLKGQFMPKPTKKVSFVW